ncbi:MAG: alpha/beta hydrolase fold protein [Segetibacter sp.]|nr:alpha/beta hydrolase fold protein [Segetibacter sp.]
MTKQILTAIFSLLLFLKVSASSNNDTAFVETSIVLHTITGDIVSTLTTPKIFKKIPVTLIIAGSGPTDRNGNNQMMKNESLKLLSYSLANNNIGSLRFDKRGIGESKGAAKSEADLRFEDYVTDAKGWVEFLKKDKRFSKVVVIGHSEGSLIGMIAALDLTDGYVSIAGAGNSAHKILKEQLANQPQMVKDLAFPIIDSLIVGKTVKDVNPALYSLFRPSIQPYMISWFRYDPQLEIKKLSIPALIIQGTNDMQVSVEDADLLAKANAHTKLVLIKNMNHVFRIVDGDRNANIATYNNSSLPISKDLTDSIVEFIKKL